MAKQLTREGGNFCHYKYHLMLENIVLHGTCLLKTLLNNRIHYPQLTCWLDMDDFTRNNC